MSKYVSKDTVILSNCYSDSDLLIFIRNKYNLTQSQLANILLVSRQYISQIENNRDKLSNVLYRKLLRKYRIKIDYVFPDVMTPEKLKEVRSIYRLTQEEVAKTVYAKTSFISHYEQGIIKTFPEAYRYILKEKLSPFTR